jgi:hypothetical protein
MIDNLNQKYKFVYQDNCCASARKEELVVCDSCGKDVCVKCAVTLNGARLHRDCSASRRHDLNLLRFFRAKNLEMKDALLLQGLDITVPEVAGYKQKPSCAVVVNSQTFIANLFMWSSGECECLVISMDTGSQVFSKNRVLNTNDEIENYLNDIYGVLLDITGMSANRENAPS